MKSSKNILLLALSLVLATTLTSCEKEEIKDPEGTNYACYVCESTITWKPNLEEDFEETFKSSTVYCNMTSLGIARMEIAKTGTVDFDKNFKGYQVLKCKKK